MTQPITIALSKGRIYKDTLPLLLHADIQPLEDPEKSRKLILDTNHEHVKLVIIRATDVPTYVQYGAADIGVAGKDVLMEHGGQDIYEPLDLKIAQCKLMTAGPMDAVINDFEQCSNIRVATKFVNVAKDFYAKQGVQAEVIKLYGSMELAPIVKLADRIVDVVDTGNTLRANGLKPMEHIADITSRLIVNKAALKLKHESINRLIEKMSEAVEKNQS